MPETPIEPDRTALLVMDYQNGLVGRIADGEALLARVAAVAERLRGAGAHVGYVRVAFEDADFAQIPAASAMAGAVTPERRATMHASAPDTAIHAAVAPRDGDMIVRKTRVGAFSTTDLHQQLRRRGVTTLVLAGISTSGVVLSTVRDAMDRDYRIIVLADACADPDPEVHAFLTERIFPRHTTVIASDELAVA